MVFQLRCGTLPINRSPRSAHPRSGAMLVLVQVSSMKTRRSAAMRPWYFVHCARRRATSGRSRSPATTLFFEAELLGVYELPHRAVIDLQSARAELRDKPAQGEVAILGPLQQPDTVLAGNCLRLVTTHLAWRQVSGVAEPVHPADGRTDADPKLLCRLGARQPATINRSHNPLPERQRIRLAHPCWPPFQPAW